MNTAKDRNHVLFLQDLTPTASSEEPRAKGSAPAGARQQAAAEGLRESQAADAASNPIVDLLEAGKVDEAEQAARESCLTG